MHRLFSFLAVASFSAHPLWSQDIVYTDQGRYWTHDLRQTFYTEDQGARIMPLGWMRALKTPDGDGFLHDALDRYGYLRMPGREVDDLPVGFTATDVDGRKIVGMSCAACHTRQIEVSGTAYRIDGGPAMVDFQRFLKDLDDAVLKVVQDDVAFSDFTVAVLGDGVGDGAKTQLKSELEVWNARYHALIAGSLPDTAWGPGRVDAVTMIFNRLGGLDLGPKDHHFLIEENIAKGIAPSRYPFLWNAAKQDYTQWPGFQQNGDALLGLSRNVGEVIGVFAEFQPKPAPGTLLEMDYLGGSSINWDGLKWIERRLWDIGAPKWPWELDDDLARRGSEIFNLSTDDGGCVECHGKTKGGFRSVLHSTYKTTLNDVGTDIAECQLLTRKIKTGSMEGAKIPFLEKPLGPEEHAIKVLGVAVLGSIMQHSLSFLDDDAHKHAIAALSDRSHPDNARVLARHGSLQHAMPITDKALAQVDKGPTDCKYEGRVLDGIWAAAPYLHNGSVPSLAELLKKPEERTRVFVPGPEYDIENVGIAVQQSKFDQPMITTGCNDLSSGNSRCGHDFGTSLSDADKKALLEYLKSI